MRLFNATLVVLAAVLLASGTTVSKADQSSVSNVDPRMFSLARTKDFFEATKRRMPKMNFPNTRKRGLNIPLLVWIVCSPRGLFRG
ncbi:hypothetical protein PF008_g32311 [Phytophthora fragariae]|uniref:RxLR effector protein n=1 Tax=Phytophthora fragariae TaxID=53985 RepID=A0A6G0Q076_9STRA|nr:hypothetical protein PF008_g32311 [Phytophthora fragariae]